MPQKDPRRHRLSMKCHFVSRRRHLISGNVSNDLDLHAKLDDAFGGKTEVGGGADYARPRPASPYAHAADRGPFTR